MRASIASRNMNIEPTAIDGVYVIDLTPISDDRGFFARSFCRDEFVERGLEPAVAQCNVSFNHAAGTLRGMHFQTMQAPEVKLVRCTKGALVDIVVDMRAGSATLGEHVAVELTEDNRRAIYVPAMFAHGYQTLVDNTEAFYQVSHPYTPNTERGLRHDDPVLGIEWPAPIEVVSEKDRNWQLLDSIDALRLLADESAGAS
jgi:dTDP-4-dehydrorhamnose 3,5-epimerase